MPHAAPAHKFSERFKHSRSVLCLSAMFLAPSVALSSEGLDAEQLDDSANQSGVSIPSKEIVSANYDEGMEFEVYDQAITAGKMLVTIDYKNGDDPTDSLIKLAEAQSLNGDYVDALSNYKSAVEIRADNDPMPGVSLDISLADPYEKIGKTYTRCLIDRVMRDEEIEDLLKTTIGKLELENPDLKDDEIIELAKDASAQEIQLITERYHSDKEIDCKDTDAIGAYDRALHIYHVNEGPYTTQQNDVLRGQIDLQVLRVNELMKLGVNEDTIHGILKETKEADKIANNLYATTQRQVSREYGTEFHPDMIPAINERAEWFERSLRFEDAQKLYIQTVTMLDELRDEEINTLVSEDLERIQSEDSSLDEDQAMEQAISLHADEIASIESKYQSMQLPQLERVARSGSNAIGDILRAQKEIEAENAFNTLEKQRQRQMRAKTRQGRSDDALEKMAHILEQDDEATPSEKAQAYIDIGDSLLAERKSFKRAGDQYQKAWEILREHGTEEEFNALLGTPRILNYEQPTHILLRRGDDLKVKGIIGRDHDGIYTVRHIFTVAANGRLKDIELDEQASDAPRGVANTQKLVLSLFTRARPKMIWETGEFEDKTMMFTRQWEGEHYRPQ